MSQYFRCPNCGADVPLKARACPECGSDEETGWSEAAKYTHLLPYTGDLETDASKSNRQKYLKAAVAVLVVTALLSAWGLSWALYVIPIVAIGSAIYYVFRKYSGSSRGMEKQLYQQLLKLSGGNKQLVARLIEYERQRHPGSSKLQLLQNAIYRWQRDR